MQQISIGQFQLTIKSGVLVPLLLMLPNFLWMVFSGPNNLDGSDQEPLWLSIFDNIGRLAVLLLPAFFVLNLDRRFATPALILMGICLLLYYSAWARYFAGGCAGGLFKTPLLGVPLPMAVFPILYLLLSSYLMGSWWMFGAVVFFGVTHLWVSAIGL
jgi:hypothetical protein